MQDIQQLQTLFLQYLREHPFPESPGELYRPADYIMQLGGKRLRPVMLLMGCDLFSEKPERALPAAMAVEVFHNFTLVHDDIMDAAPLRRGKPTVHALYDTNTAILSGDVMLIHAYQWLMKCHSLTHPRLNMMIGIFNEVAIGVCEGQQMDVNFERRSDVQIDEYLRMIELKTAVLIAGALQMGAIIGDARAEDAFHLYEFGRLLGIAFQLQDDLLDTFGDPLKFGKKVGGDIAQCKKTYLYLRALELSSEPKRAALRALYEGQEVEEEERIDRVTEQFRALGIPEETMRLQLQYQNEAFRHLDAIQKSDEHKDMLRQLARDLLIREL